MFLGKFMEEIKAPPRARLRRVHFLMGCFVEIEAFGENRNQLACALEAAFAEMRRLEGLLSKFLPESEVSLINQVASLSPIQVPAEVFDLLEECCNFSEACRGAFDITVAPFIDLWHSAARRNEIPSAKDRRTFSPKVGYRQIVLDPEGRTVLFKQPGMKIDLGAVGKGYAVDRATGILRGHGIENAMISTGSSIFCLGARESWFGVSNPSRPQEILTAVPLKNNALSTSANQERFLSIRGRRFGHLIDPRTGYPGSNGLLSVTVVAGSAKRCEMLSTAAFVLGKEEGSRFIRSLPDVRAVFIAAAKPFFRPSTIEYV